MACDSLTITEGCAQIDRGTIQPSAAAAVGRPLVRRTRVSSGKKALPHVDGRTLAARRFKDILDALTVDQGGLDRLSEARVQLCRRFAALAVQAESLEARLANGEQVDIGEQALLASALVRIATRIGLDRRARNIVPTLEDYLDAKVATEGEAAA